MVRTAFAGLLALSSLGIERDACAVDPFEIQVYDGTADAVGQAGLELHLNVWATGHREAAAPELPLHGQYHATLEPSFGVMPFWEVGAYLQSALRDDGTVDYAGAKLRSKFVTPPDWDPHWRLGLNLEVSLLPERYDHDRWGSEIRPIIAWSSPRWLFVVNPILDQALAGSDAAAGPWFEPAFKAARTIGPVAAGLEYYASIGPISAPLPWRLQEHYIYEVVDLVSVEGLEVELGLGEGLTSASEGVIVKAILGYEFDLLATNRAHQASNAMRRDP